MADRKRKRTRQGKSHPIDPEYAAQDRNRQGPSPGNPIDEEVINSPKSDWVEKDSPAAGDQVTPDELKAFDLLGRAGVRDDAIEGPSASHGMPTPASGRTPGAKRRNPPLPEVSDEIDMSGRGDGGGGASGGAAGGARGNSGSDSRGAGSAGRGTDQAARRGPAEFDAGSRFDYDAPDDTVGEEEDDGAEE